MRNVILLFIVILLFSVSCSKKDDSESEKMVGLPNPMVEIINDSEFFDVLNIKFDSNKLEQKNLKKFIISKKVGDIRWSIVNDDLQNIECTLRFTKDEELSQTLSGIYGEKIQLDNKNIDDTNIKIEKTSNENYIIYSFNIKNIFCSLTLNSGKLNEINIDKILTNCLKSFFD